MKTRGYNSLTSWIALIAVSIIAFFLAAPMRLAGLFFVILLDGFNTDRKSASVPIVIFGLLRTLTGPFTAILGETFGFQTIILTGSIFGSVGIASCFFAEDITVATISIGLIYGVGIAFGCTLIPTILKLHFTEHYNLVNGIWLTGTCAGAVVLSPVITSLQSSYGTNGMFLILGGIFLNCIPAAIILKHPHNERLKCKTEEKQNSNSLEETSNTYYQNHAYIIDEPKQFILNQQRGDILCKEVNTVREDNLKQLFLSYLKIEEINDDNSDESATDHNNQPIILNEDYQCKDDTKQYPIESFLNSQKCDTTNEEGNKTRDATVKEMPKFSDENNISNCVSTKINNETEPTFDCLHNIETKQTSFYVPNCTKCSSRKKTATKCYQNFTHLASTKKMLFAASEDIKLLRYIERQSSLKINHLSTRRLSHTEMKNDLYQQDESKASAALYNKHLYNRDTKNNKSHRDESETLAVLDNKRVLDGEMLTNLSHQNKSKSSAIDREKRKNSSLQDEAKGPDILDKRFSNMERVNHLDHKDKSNSLSISDDKKVSDSQKNTNLNHQDESQASTTFNNKCISEKKKREYLSHQVESQASAILDNKRISGKGNRDYLTDSDESKDTLNKTTIPWKSFRLFADPTFHCIMIVQSIHGFVTSLNWTIIVDYGRDKGMPIEKAVYFTMFISVAEMFGNMCLNWVTDCHFMTRTNFSFTCFLILVLDAGYIIWAQEFFLMMIGVLIFGFMTGAVATIFPGIIIEYIEEEQQNMALASRFILYGFLCILKTPIIGYFRGTLGSYDWVYCIIIASSLICCIFQKLIPVLAFYRNKKYIIPR